MKAVYVVNRLKEILPKYTDDFSTIISVSSLVRSGSTITCTTATAHGLTTGQYATLRGAKRPIALDSISFSNGVATATSLSDHLLSDPSKYADDVFIEIAGATGFNGSWKLLSVPDKLTFTFAITGSPSPVSGGFLLLEDQDGYNGYKQVSVVNSTTFTYSTTASLQSPAQGSIQVSCLTRVDSAATPQRIAEFYSPNQSQILQTWAYVVLGGMQAFKNDSVIGDSNSANKKNEAYYTENQQQFSVYVVIPAKDSILGGDIADTARGYLKPLLKCLANYVFSSDFSESSTQPCQFVGDEADDYIGATYTHRFDFTTQQIIQTGDTSDFSNGTPLQSIEGLLNDELEFSPTIR